MDERERRAEKREKVFAITQNRALKKRTRRR